MSTQRVVRFALETISNLPSYPSHYLLQPASPSAHQSSRTKFLQRLVRYHLNWFLFSFSRHAIAPFVVVNSRSCLFRLFCYFFVFVFLVGILLVCNKLAKNTLPISAIIHLTHTLALTFVLLLATTATTHTAYANASCTVENKEVCTLPAISLSLSKLFPLCSRDTNTSSGDSEFNLLSRSDSASALVKRQAPSWFPIPNSNSPTRYEDNVLSRDTGSLQE